MKKPSLAERETIIRWSMADVKYLRFGKPASKAQREHALSIAFTAQNRPQPAASCTLQPCG